MLGDHLSTAVTHTTHVNAIHRAHRGGWSGWGNNLGLAWHLSSLWSPGLLHEVFSPASLTAWQLELPK